MNDYAQVRHDIAPNTPEWLELRKGFRTASEAAIVMGLSPFQTPESFKLIKAGLKKQYYSKAMQLGHELEAQVRKHAGDHFDLNFEEQIWTRGKYLASLDGIDGDTLVEIKVSDHTYNALHDGDIPEYYHAQVQQQLHCSPAKVGYIYAYSPKKDAYIHSTPIEEQPDFMLTVEAAWEKFEAMLVPEKIDFSDDGSVVNLFQEYEQLKRQADALKEQMDAIKAQLVERANEHSIEAQGYKLTKSKPRTSYDYSKACKDAKLDMEAYKKVGESSWSIKLAPSPFEATE